MSVSDKFLSNFDASDSSLVTKGGDRFVSAFSDKLGNVSDFVQATSSDKPIYSRADNKENFQSNSGDASGFPYSRDGITCAGDVLTETVDGEEISFGSVIEDSSTGNHRWNNISQGIEAFPGVAYRWFAIVKRLSGERHVCIRALAPGLDAQVILDLDSRVITKAGTSANDVAEFVEDLGGGWFKFGAVGTAEDYGFLWAYLELRDSVLSNSYAGDGTSGIYAVFSTQEAAADPVYIPNEGAGLEINFRGVQGKSTIVLGHDQSRYFTNGDSLSDLFNAGAKHIWFAVQQMHPFRPQYLLSDTNEKFSLLTLPGLSTEFVAANSEYLSLANGSSGDLVSGADGFSISLFFKPNGIAAEGTLASVFGSSANERRWTIRHQTDSAIAVYHSSDGTAEASIVTTDLADDGEWNHLVVVFDVTNAVRRIYLNNGTPVEAAGALTFHNSAASFNVGAEDEGGSGYFNGKISCLNYWHDKVLSEDEISFLYNDGKGRRFQELSGDLDTDYAWNLDEHKPTANSQSTPRKAKSSSYDLTENNSVLSSADHPNSEISGKPGIAAYSSTENFSASFVSSDSTRLVLSNGSAGNLVSGLESWSLSLWARAEDLAASGTLCGVDGSGSNERRFGIEFQSTGAIRFRYSSNGSSYSDLSSAGPYSAGTWYHITAKYDAVAQMVYLKVGEAAEVSASFASAFYDSSASFLVGADAEGTSGFFNGQISMLQFWYGKALTAEEVEFLRNEGQGRFGSELGLINTAGAELYTPYAWDLTEESDGSGAVVRSAEDSSYNLTDEGTTASATKHPRVSQSHAVSASIGEVRPVDVIHIEHENDLLKISVNGSTKSVVSCGDTEDLSGTLLLGVRETTGESFFSSIKFCQMITAGEACSDYEATQVTNWLRQRWNLNLPKTEKYFLVRLDLEAKDSSGTKTLWFGTESAVVDELYVGGSYVYPILDKVSGLGQDFGSGQVLPQNRVGSVTLSNTRGSITHDTRLGDLSDFYAFLGASVSIYSFQKPSGMVGDSEDLASEFSGEVVSFSINPQSSTISLSVQGGLRAPVTLQTRVDKKAFPAAPDRSVGQYLPLIFGQTEVTALKIEALKVDSSALMAEYAFATTVGTTFQIDDVEEVYVEAGGEYRRVDGAADYSSSVIEKSPTSTVTLLGTNTDTYIEIDYSNSSDNYVVTHARLSLKGTSTFYTGSVGGTVGAAIVRTPSSSDYPNGDSEVVAAGSVEKDPGLDWKNDGVDFTVDIPLSRPAVLYGGGAYWLKINNNDEDNSVKFIRPRDLSSGTHQVVIFERDSNETTIYPTSSSYSYALFAAEFEVDVGSSLNVAKFRTRHMGVDVDSDCPGMDNLKIILGVSGLLDDGSGTVTGTADKQIETPDDVIRFLWYLSHGNSLADLDTSRVSEVALIELDGASQGGITARDLMAEVARHAGMALFPLRSGKTAVWGYPSSQSSVVTITENDCNLLSIQSSGLSEIVNEALIAYDRTALPLPVEDIEAGNPQNYLKTLDANPDSDGAFPEILERSQSLYGERPLSQGFQNLSLIADDGAASHYVTVIFEQKSFEKTQVSIQVPFWLRELRTVELFDLLRLSHIDLPFVEGTEGANTTKAPTVYPFCATFDSSNSEYLSLDNGDLGDLLPGDSDFSVSFWFKLSDVSTPQNILGIWGSAGARCWELWNQATGRLYFSISADGTAATSAATSVGVIESNAWVHLVATHDASSNQIALSINNGEATALASHSGGAYASSSGDFWVGGAGSSQMTGKIQKVQYFYNKVLSSNEIAWLYNSGTGRSGIELGQADNDGQGLYTPYAWDLTEESDGSEAVARRAIDSAYSLTDNNTVPSEEDSPGYRQVLDSANQGHTLRRAIDRRYRVRGRYPLINVRSGEESLIRFSLESIGPDERA